MLQGPHPGRLITISAVRLQPVPCVGLPAEAVGGLDQPTGPAQLLLWYLQAASSGA